VKIYRKEIIRLEKEVTSMRVVDLITRAKREGRKVNIFSVGENVRGKNMIMF
jgi:hypothetical protein